MTRKIHVIMPMAGEGSRFKEAGIDTPKPLIKFKDICLFQHSLSILDGINIATRTFIVRKEHVEKYNIDKEILKIYPDAIILKIDKTTRGAAETVMIAVRALINLMLIDFNDSLVVMDCDVKVESEDWRNIIQNPKADGILLTFNSTDDRYSYAAVKHGRVTYTAEKNPISNHAITSPYFFKRVSDFFDMFIEMEKFFSSDTQTYKEMYMSVIYNFLCVNKNKKVITVDVDKIISLGTPEELEKANLYNS